MKFSNKTIRILSTVVSVLGGLFTLIGSILTERRNTIEINEAVDKMLNDRGL